MKFTIEDIRDKEKLNQMVEVEAKHIYDSTKSRKGRSWDEVYAHVLQGKVAELYLIESGEFEPADLKYHDLKDKEGNYIEVKAYSTTDRNSVYTAKELKRIKAEGWNKSKYVMLFSYIHGDYELIEKIDLYPREKKETMSKPTKIVKLDFEIKETELFKFNSMSRIDGKPIYDYYGNNWQEDCQHIGHYQEIIPMSKADVDYINTVHCCNPPADSPWVSKNSVETYISAYSDYANIAIDSLMKTNELLSKTLKVSIDRITTLEKLLANK